MIAWASEVLRSKAFFLLFLGAFTASTAWARSNSAIQAFNEGVKLFNAKQYSDAIPKFDDALSSDQQFPEAYFARGASRYYLKSLDGALMDLNEALRLKPDYLQARSLRGAVQYESDRWDEALSDFNAVLKADPHEAQALLGRAVIRLKRNDLAGATRDFKVFLSVRPNDPLAPRVKEVLASMRRVPEEPPADEAAQMNVPVHHPLRAPSMERLNHMADSLLGSPMEDAYSRQVLRGDQGPAVGDIRKHPGVPQDEKDDDLGDEIVEPK